MIAESNNFHSLASAQKSTEKFQQAYYQQFPYQKKPHRTNMLKCVKKSDKFNVMIYTNNNNFSNFIMLKIHRLAKHPDSVCKEQAIVVHSTVILPSIDYLSIA